MDILKRNNVRVSGSGSRPMVFAHGFGCDQNMWRLVTPEFSRDHKIVLYDHVGAGRSDLSAYDPGKYSSLDGYATDALEICESLSLKDVIFVGHSVSAMIGVLAAIRRPDLFSHLIMVGPSPRYINDDSYHGGFSTGEIEELLSFLETNHLGWSAAMAPVIMGNPDRPELGQELTESFCTTDPVIARQFARVTFLSDNREDLSRLTIPSLIIQCNEDVIAPLTIGEYCKEHISGSSLVVLNATGHCPQLSAPDETAHAIRRYLEQADSP